MWVLALVRAIFPDEFVEENKKKLLKVHYIKIRLQTQLYIIYLKLRMKNRGETFSTEEIIGS